MILFRFLSAKRADLITQLSLSVPPEVKYISSGEAPMHVAMVSLADFRAFFADLANE